MSQFFKGIALFIAVCCLVWVTVLWRWQATQRDMSPSDIVLYLGVLPVVLFVLMVLGRWAFTSAAAKADARAAAGVAAAAAAGASKSAAAQPGGAASDAARRSTLQMLSAAVCTPAGVDPSGLEAAVAEGQPRPAPDTELRDDEGLPVMCARVAELALDDTDEAWARALKTARARQPDWATREPDDSVRRAVAALDMPVRQALMALTPWAARLGLRDGQAEPQTERRDAAPMLRVLPGWPAHWHGFDRAVAHEVLREVVADALPPIAAPQRVVWMTDHANGATSQWLVVDALFQAMQREERDDLVLVTACHSDLSDARIEQLQRDQRLYCSQHPRMPMPGEGAAALVLAGPTWPLDPDAVAPPVHLHRPAVGQRDKPVDSPGKVASSVLEACINNALSGAGVPATDVAAVCSDADQHTARAAELFGAMLGLLPQLDAVEDTRLAGTLLGHADATGVLLTLALAAELASKRKQPCLALSLDDPQARLALVARPAPPATAELPSAA